MLKDSRKCSSNSSCKIEFDFFPGFFYTYFSSIVPWWLVLISRLLYKQPMMVCPQRHGVLFPHQFRRNLAPHCGPANITILPLIIKNISKKLLKWIFLQYKHRGRRGGGGLWSTCWFGGLHLKKLFSHKIN